MILLKNTTDKLSVINSTASTDVDITAHYIDITQANPPVPQGDTSGRQLTNTATNETKTIVDAPASGDTRKVKLITIRNAHASTSTDITVQYDANATLYELHKVTLLAGECLEYAEGLGFYTLAAGKTAASQSDQETGTSLTTFVAPGTQHYHPSACKCWGKATVSGGTPSLAASYNMTSLTDAGVSRLTITIATDFSSAHYSANVTIEAQTTTYSATTTCLAPVIRNATLAAGSFTADALEFDIGQATDVASWHWSCFGDQ